MGTRLYRLVTQQVVHYDNGSIDKERLAMNGATCMDRLTTVNGHVVNAQWDLVTLFWSRSVGFDQTQCGLISFSFYNDVNTDWDLRLGGIKTRN